MLNGSSLNMFIHWGFVGAAKISIARPNLFGHYTVVQNPCLPVPRPQNQLQSTRYLANPELTRTRQNTRYKVLHISRHFFKTITTDNKSSPYFSHHGHFSKKFYEVEITSTVVMKRVKAEQQSISGRYKNGMGWCFWTKDPRKKRRKQFLEVVETKNYYKW